MNKSNNLSTIYLETLGCSKNQVDSDRIERFLLAQGFRSAPLEEAEIILLNTCGFIQAAVEESIERILELADHKDHQAKLLIMMGCLTQRYQDVLETELPEVDLFIGTGYLEELAEIIRRPDRRVYLDRRDAPETGKHFPLVSAPSYSYLKIAEGCDNFCSYCIIPQLRGPFRSRRIQSLVQEAEEVASQGIKEIILIAQDTARFGYDTGEGDLLDLLKALHEVEGVEWIRIQYLYPDTLDRSFFEQLAKLPKVVPYFDIPIQHASNTVLKRMNRHTSKEHLIEVMTSAREVLAEAVLRTSIIVGFPGETEAEFSELMDFVREHPFDRLGTFIYSDEEESASYQLPNKIAQDVKQERLERLMRLQEDISQDRLSRLVGQTIPVIIDVGGKQPVGRTRYDAPEVDGVVDITTDRPLKKGQIVPVRITQSSEHDLEGVVV